MAAQEHKKIDLAVEQLTVALELFLARRSFVSALTLGGAAEEVFGKALAQNTLQDEYTFLEPVNKLLRRKPYEWKEFVSEKNRVRNAAKHMQDPSQSSVIADIEDEALWMLVRACDNYKRLELAPIPQMQQFEEWFYENVVGIEDGL